MYQSTIRGRRASSKTENIFAWILEKVSQFFSWIKSWFSKGKEGKKEEEERFCKVDINGKSIRYRIEDSENEVHMGPRGVRLIDVTFPDKDEIENLGEMLSHIMQEEKIDFVMTTNFYHSWLLWTADLFTKSEIPFSPKSRAPLNKFIHSILQETNQKRSNRKLDDVLKKIESKMVLSIIDEAIDTGENTNQNFHQSAGAPQDIVKNCFRNRQAIKHILALEKALGYQLDLESLAKDFEKNSVQKLALKLLAEKIDRNMNTTQEIGEFQVAIQHLFPLVKELGKEIKRDMVYPIPYLNFSKGENHAN